MTTLTHTPVSNPDELALFADLWTPLGKPFAEKFRAACEAEARANGGRVNPNNVRARLIAEPDYDPRRYAAQWGPACGPRGFMVKTAELIPIDPDGSRGNGNKAVVARRWVA